MDQQSQSNGIYPAHIGKYRIIRQIGEGGMGDIYLGEDQLGMQVAIKAYPAWSLATEQKRKRFLREARLLAGLKHPGICRIYGVEEAGDRPFIIMEHLEGVTLATLLRYLAKKSTGAKGAGSSIHQDITTVIKSATNSGNGENEVPIDQKTAVDPRPDSSAGRSEKRGPLLPAQQALTIIAKLCDALHYSHQHGIIHRDLKPSNIIIRPDGEPVLLDFGIARHLDDSETLQLTGTGELLGTLGYMAPEQARGKRDLDERVDVFALGAIAYEMLTGRKAFRMSGNVMEDYERFLDFEPIPPRRYDKRFDRELEAILLKAIAPEPSHRYRFVARLNDDINRYTAGEPVRARRPSPLYRLAKFIRRHQVTVSFVSLATTGIITALIYLGIDYYMQKGRWITVYAHDFTTGTYDTSAIDFTLAGASIAPWRVDSTGLHLGNQSWCWFSAAQIPENCRVEFEVEFRGNPDGIELCLNSKRKKKTTWADPPAGYSCQIGGYNGTIDFISVNRREALARSFELMESSVKAGEPIRVVFERIDDRLILRNGGNSVEAVDFAPMYGEAFRHIGLHTYASAARLRKIRISRMALARKPSPLVAGDVLLSEGAYEDACETFLRIGRDHPRSRVGRKALVRAYYASRYLEDSHADSLREWIRSTMERDYAATAEWEALQFLVVEDHWNIEDAAIAVDHLEKLIQRSKEPRYLNYLAPRKIPREYAARATRLLVSSGNRIFLDVSAMLGDSLEILQGANIFGLTAKSNDITDLEALRGMPLVWLTLDDNRIHDLAAVANPRLRLLSAHGNHIEDLSPLRDCKLTALNLSGNRIEDITPLVGMPLTSLELGQNRIRDITPLSRMDLKAANLQNNRIRDLGPLAASQLRHLFVRGNPVEDFAPIAGLPLRRFSASDFRQEDLEYLKGTQLANLEVFGGSLQDLSPLSGQPLQRVQLEDCGLTDLGWARRFNISVMQLRDNDIEDLSPLRGLNISSLDVLGNHITDLSPLNDVPLSSLRCSNNPLVSLGPLVENPPREFEFWCPTLPEHELLRAINIWHGKPNLEMHRKQAQSLYYLKTGKLDSLKSLGFEVEGNRYLHVKWSATFHQADSLARLLGGHLWTLSFPTEAAQVAQNVPGPRRIWINAELRDGRWIWRHPSGDQSLLLHSGRDPRFPYIRMRFQKLTKYAVPVDATSGFIIEWEGASN